MNHKYKIVYILGAGHSGSTLLDTILGSDNSCFSVGELFYYNIYNDDIKGKKYIKNKVCTCGKKLNKCNLWKNIVDKNVSLVTPRYLGESLKILTNIINPFEKYLNFKIRVGQNKYMYDLISSSGLKSKKNFKYIIDSSKDPRRLYELIKDKKIDNNNIYVIHLIRDGVDYSNSFKKDIRLKLGLNKRNIFSTSIEWILINMISKIMIRKYNLRNVNVSYDNLVKDSQFEFQKLNIFLNTKIRIQTYIHRINDTTYHNINGNVTKKELFKGINVVKKKRYINNFEFICLVLILYPFNKLWNYGK